MSVGGVGGHRHQDFDVNNEGAEAVSLPRSGWKDGDKLEKAVSDAKASVDASRSRPNHRTKWVDAKNDRTEASSRTGKAQPAVVALSGKKGASKPDHSRPVIVAKYGIPSNWGGGGGSTHPVIVAKYGVPANHGGGGTTHPVIVAKYGVPANHGGGGGGGTHPVIVAKYGVPANHGGGGGGSHPVIVAKYGVPSNIRHR